MCVCVCVCVYVCVCVCVCVCEPAVSSKPEEFYKVINKIVETFPDELSELSGSFFSILIDLFSGLY